jgi:hypothetical protein
MVVKGLFEANGLGFYAIHFPAFLTISARIVTPIGAREATSYTKISNTKYNSI